MTGITRIAAAGALAASTALTPALAQDEPMRYTPDFEAMALENWTPEDYAGTWQADELIEEADVYGADGEMIGEVEDIVVGKDETVRSFIIETDDFLDIGDTHFAVPWAEVTVVSYDRVEVPLSEETVEDYGLAEDMDDEIIPGRAWRIGELVNDYAVLRDGEAFGFVQDVLIGKDGAIRAVMVRGTDAYGYDGPYAMPYYGYDYGWGPGYDRYYMGHAPEELDDVPVITGNGPEPYFSQ